MTPTPILALLALSDGIAGTIGAALVTAIGGLWAAWLNERKGRAKDNERWLGKYADMHTESLDRERASTAGLVDSSAAKRELAQAIRDLKGK